MERDNLINQIDMDTIECIAHSYNMSVLEFARYLSKIAIKNESGVRQQVRFSDEELEKLDRKAAQIGVSRSKLFNLAIAWFINNAVYRDLDVVDYYKYNTKAKSTRKNRICILIKNDENFNKLRILSEKLSLNLSELLRYCVMDYNP